MKMMQNSPVTHKNHKYYFCCNWCKKQFEENPKRYSRLGINASVDLNESTSG